MQDLFRFLSICLLATSGMFSSESKADTSQHSSSGEVTCVPCDAPDMPRIGRNALKNARGNAYEAVNALLPSAESGYPDSQIAIAFIIHDWLTGHLNGHSTEPFTWRENWVWWHFAAYKSGYMAGLLGGAYAEGATGLRKNEKLSSCLVVRNAQPVQDRVAQCFRKFGN